jgi:hypothetical protein
VPFRFLHRPSLQVWHSSHAGLHLPVLAPVSDRPKPATNPSDPPRAESSAWRREPAAPRERAKESKPSESIISPSWVTLVVGCAAPGAQHTPVMTAGPPGCESAVKVRFLGRHGARRRYGGHPSAARRFRVCSRRLIRGSVWQCSGDTRCRRRDVYWGGRRGSLGCPPNGAHRSRGRGRISVESGPTPALWRSVPSLRRTPIVCHGIRVGRDVWADLPPLSCDDRPALAQRLP